MTQQQKDRLDRLVEDYLGAVSYACVDLPPDRRDDLVADLREHIEAARGVLYQPTEAAVRTILDRLGEPAAIAAEARLAEGLPAAATMMGLSAAAAVPGLPAAGGLSAAAGVTGRDSDREVSRSSTATLGMLLGFVLIVLIVLAGVAMMILFQTGSPGVGQ
jgi:uncharacterized membrane protein